MKHILFLFTLACTAGCCFAAADAADTKKPNVVFFLIDDLGVNDIGANNPKTFYETPNVDQLAREGVRFTNGYTACCVCSPTRYSIQSGKYPARGAHTIWFGSTDNGKVKAKFRDAEYVDQMALSEITLGEAFHDAGYKTVFVGKWHLGPNEDFYPEKQGYDVNIAGGKHGNPGKDGYFSPYNELHNLPNGPEGEYLTHRLAREAAEQIKQAKDKPFLLYFATYQVHTPLQAPEALIKKYEEKAARLGLPTKGPEVFVNSEENNPANGQPIRIRQIQSLPVYAAMVEEMDAAVGKVIQTLKDEGIYDNMVIVFVSDNGGQAGQPTSNLPLRAGKGWVYEGGHRVPYIIKAPGIKSGVSDTPVITTDFYPTLLELAGLPLKPQQHLDGVSLKPVLDGGSIAERPLYWHYPHYTSFPAGALRDGDWKFIRRYEDGKTELYNLKSDPYETADLSGKETAKVRELAEKHNAWLKSVNARFLREKDGSGKPWQPE
ncbi:MAG: sulfatase [Planctomycetaceae bacterium]|jgi:arylsulfatase A-like enzyme|nr:sulfatase [Planctomycetaceae bacterium]